MNIRLFSEETLQYVRIGNKKLNSKDSRQVIESSQYFSHKYKVRFHISTFETANTHESFKIFKVGKACRTDGHASPQASGP